MEDFIIKETMNTMKDDTDGHIWYQILFEMTRKNGDQTILLKAEAEMTPDDGSDSALKEAKKQCRIAGRYAFIHALEKYWEDEKKKETAAAVAPPPVPPA